MAGRKAKPKPKSVSTDETNNATLQSNEGIPILDNRVSILRLKCQKLKYEIENIKQQRQVLSMSKRNILLHIENLKMKYENLNADISILKNRIAVECDNKLPPLIENKSSPIKPKEEVIVSETEKRVPYILLLKSKNIGAERKRVYIEKIFDTEIKECFEIVSMDPFEISPVNNDVTIKVEHYEAMKPCIIRGISNCDNLIPCITVQETKNSNQCFSIKNDFNDSKNSLHDNDDKSLKVKKTKNVIDLTDSEELLVSRCQNTNISAKRKNESQNSDSMSVLKKCFTVKDSQSVETTTKITKTTTTTKVNKTTNHPNVKIDMNDGIIEIN